ncbi:MAG: glycosyltransferase family 2 protein [Gemmatimonadales bacterium]
MSDGDGTPPALAVVIPAFRAAAVLPGVLERVKQAAPGSTTVVVDDGSDDDTAALAACAGAIVLRHPANRGKGRSLATGLAAAVAGGADVIVTMDADGQHPPEAIPLLVEPLQAGRADLVVGARARGEGMPGSRKMSNWLSSALISRAVGFRVPDSQSGFRAMRRGVAAVVRPRGHRYEYETEFLLLAARAGYRIVAVTVPTVYDGAPSHFRYGADTLAVAAVFVRHWRGVLLGPGTAR